MTSPTADVSVRVAWADDAEAIAEVQARAWRTTYAGLVPDDALAIDPAERGRGHGSRLLQAVVDTMQADRFSRAVTWTIATDDALRRFLTEAGWAPDTAHRELDLDGEGTTLVKQVRLHTSFS